MQATRAINPDPPEGRLSLQRPMVIVPASWWRTMAPLLSLLAIVLSGGVAQAQTPIEVTQTDGLLTIRATNARALDLATALTEKTGIRFVVTGSTDSSISTDIVDEPFDKAVAKLSPNHMLVRESAAADAEVIEVVLMMDDAQGGGGNTAEFLPSGAPADEVIVENPVTNADGSQMTDTMRSMLEQPNPDASAAGGASVNAGAGEIDPNTGLPVQEVTGNQTDANGEPTMSMPPPDDPVIPAATQ